MDIIKDKDGANQIEDYKSGLISALICNTWWGIMPIYWQWLRPIDSIVIIFYRIVLVAVVCLIFALKKHGINEIIENLKAKGVVVRYILAGLLITANWSIYIWAVNADFVIQTCIGYYIEPIIVCLLGIFIFKDRMDKYKTIALLFAVAGVAVVILHFGEVPLIAIGISLTFAVYAALKKNFTMPPVLSLLYETIFIMPFALIVVIYLEFTGQGALGALGDGEQYKYFLLMFCGLFTAFPLTLFANAANKVSLFILGLTEYISPTLSLIISIYIFKEAFDSVQLIAFAIIWVGLTVFSYGEYKNMKTTKLSEIEGNH